MMNPHIGLIENILWLLNNSTCYALLRNYEGLPEINHSRDIDILIEKRGFMYIRSELLQVILSLGYRIVTYYKSDRMYTFVCAGPQLELIQFDFFFKSSFRGLHLVDAGEMLESRIFNGKLYHVSKEYEFLDKYLYFKVLNRPYPEKYEHIRQAVIHKESFKDIIRNKIGVNSYEELEKLSASKTKRILFFRNFAANIISFFGYMYYELVNLIVPQGYSIGFTGPDGAGKTTVIEKIIDHLSNKHGEIKLFHHRPTLIGNISNVAKSAGLVKSVDDNYHKPHRGKQQGVLSSFFRLCYYSVDYVAGYWLRVRPILFRRGIVFFDRYYTDIVADSCRSRIYLSPKFLYYWGKIFIPDMKYNILLTAEPETVLARKRELNQQGVEDINEKLSYLSAKKGYYLVWNNGTADNTAQQILTLVFDRQHKKNIKRLGGKRNEYRK